MLKRKKYTYSVPHVPKDQAWGAEDPDGTKLTDGVVGSSYTGGAAMLRGAIWNKPTEITVDLGESKKCAAFRIHTCGYEWWDAMKGEVKDKVEVLTSVDGKEFTSQGSFDFNLHWKDIPVNYMWTDEETFCGHNFMLAAKAPVQARYVRYKVEPKRMLDITELQVLESFEFKPFDLRLALPDMKDNGKAPPAPGVSPNAKQWKDGEKPTTIGKEFIREAL